jgi:hypothetical protein
MYKDAQPAVTVYGLVYPRAAQGTLVSHTPVQDQQFGSQTISTTE